MAHLNDIHGLVAAELSNVADPARRNALKAVLVPPQRLSLKWGYGQPGERYDCWLVGLSPNGQLRLMYCERGFGPDYPWGIVPVAEERMGMDCDWHVGLEHAAINAGILPPPDNYEIP